jgi:glycosyltransferase involved in cell wall biosynthesis
MWQALFSRKRASLSQPPYQGKVEIFSRHCYFSDASPHKKRPEGFSRELCYRNLLETFDSERANLTFIYDAAKGTDHFLKNELKWPVVQIQEGSEAAAFLRLLDHLESLNLHPETIVYLVEDDYLHREGWLDVLIEGLELADYATLYDHKDKYFEPMYKALKSKIFLSASTHWRTIPSTTQTFAARWKTLKRDLSTHRRFSRKVKISEDHKKFTLLTKRGATLISPMPGWATHAEPEFASPLVNWNHYLNQGV